MIVGMGISFALPPLVAEADGAGKFKRISVFLKHSLVINIGFALLSIAILIGSLSFLQFLGQDPEVVEYAKPYIFLTAISLLPFMVFQTFRCYSDGKSKTLPPMIAMIVGNILNVVLNYIFIFGHFGVGCQFFGGVNAQGPGKLAGLLPFIQDRAQWFFRF